MTLRRFAWLAPLASVALAGCFATRNDVRLLQADVARLNASAEQARQADAARARAEQAHRDSLAQAQLDQIKSQNRALSDTLNALSELFMRFRAQTSQHNRDEDEQMVQVMGMLGVSQKVLTDLRAKTNDAQRVEAASAAASADTSTSPRRMYQTGLDLLRNGSTNSARNVFKDLIDTYKTDSLAAGALYWIGYSYTLDKNDAAADSTFALFVTTYPKSTFASNALFKRGAMLEAAGKPREARAMYTRIVNEYRSSPEADLAREKLKQLPPP